MAYFKRSKASRRPFSLTLKRSERSKNSFESSVRNSDETLAPKTQSSSIPMQTHRGRFPRRVLTK